MKRSVAPSEIRRFTLLFKCTAPVSQTPGGTMTCPPPAAWQAAIALAIASMQFPSGVAPKSVMGKLRSGKFGAVIRASTSASASAGHSPASTSA